MVEELHEITETDSINVMEMSDEDFSKLPEPSIKEVVDEPESNTSDSGDDDTSDSDTESQDTEEAEDNSEESEGDSEEVSAEQSNETIKEKPEETSIPEQTTPDIDYKAEYDRLTAPFKANGIDIQVKSTDEIISLMQMGANYHKKMASLKPSLKIMKLLERNELLDESKLSYLIDLSKKNPAAITKLVKDSGIDPMSIDTEAENKYTSQTQSISDTEMELEAILESIQETPTYAKTLQVVCETWDDASRNAIAASPKIISIINEHIGNGVFDKVYNEVQRARSFGKLVGISDFEAYKQMGDYLHSQGLLTPPEPKQTVNTEKITAQKKEVESKRKALKKAATITSGKPAAPKKTVDNLLSLSDEDFEKLPASAYTKL